MPLDPSGFELADYGTVGWNAIYSSNFQKLNNYLTSFLSKFLSYYFKLSI